MKAQAQASYDNTFAIETRVTNEYVQRLPAKLLKCTGQHPARDADRIARFA